MTDTVETQEVVETPGTDIPGEEIPAEVQARKMGWVPEDEWKGPKEKWRPAEEFVERQNNILPIMRERMDKLTRQLEDQNTLIKQMYEQSRSAQENARRKGYQEALEQISAKQREAVSVADADEFDRLERKKAELIQDFRKEAETQRGQTLSQSEQDNYRVFLTRNPWYGTDKVKTAYARDISMQLRLPNGDTNYLAIEQAIAEQFPEKNPNRDKPDAVGSGTQKTQQSKKKDFDSLPAEQKALFEKLKREIPTVNKQTYAKDYWDQF